MTRTTLMLATLLLAAHCGTLDPEQPPRPQPVDAGTPDDCQRACENGRSLGCEWAEDTVDENGDPATCEDVCWSIESSGYVTVDPACLAELTDCDTGACVWEAEP